MPKRPRKRALVLSSNSITLHDTASNTTRASIQFNTDNTITLCPAAGSTGTVRLRNIGTGTDPNDAVSRADLADLVGGPLVVKLSQTNGRLCEDESARVDYGTTLSTPPSAVWSWSVGVALARIHRLVVPCTDPCTGLDLVERRGNYELVMRFADDVQPLGVTFVDLVTLVDHCHVGISYTLTDRSLRWVRWYEDNDVVTTPITVAADAEYDVPHSSVMLANGCAMLLWTTRKKQLECAVAADARNLTFLATVTIATGLSPAVCSQLRLVEGNPAVAYQTTATVTTFTRNAAADGSGAWVVQAMPATTTAATVRSMSAAVAGRPVVVRMPDTVGQAAVYSRATTATGVGGAWTNWVQTTAFTGPQRCHLAVAGGVPWYLCATDGRVFRSGVATGEDVWTSVATAWPGVTATPWACRAIGRPLSGGTAIQFLKVYDTGFQSVYIADAAATSVTATVESLSFRDALYGEPVSCLAMTNIDDGENGHNIPNAVAFAVVGYGAILLYKGCDTEHQTVVFR
jgi:hypothetical protein